MSKRFIDTKIFDQEWFGEITAIQKLLWFYLFCQCDGVGIYELNFKKASFDLGVQISLPEIEALGIGTRVISISEKKIWLSGFIKFQYKNFSPKNHAQRGMMRTIVEAVGKLPLTGDSLELIERFQEVIKTDPQMNLNWKSSDTAGNGNGNGNEVKTKNHAKTKKTENVADVISENGLNNVLKNPEMAKRFNNLKRIK